MSDYDLLAKLAAEYFEWFEQHKDALAETRDPVQAWPTLLKGLHLMKRLEDEKTARLAAWEREVDERSAADGPERTARLLQLFETGCELRDILNDEVADFESANAVVRKLEGIVGVLDGTPGGRDATLAPLLDDPRAAVAATAGAYLVDRFPDRVLPVLRAIYDARGLSSRAGSVAYWAIRRYEIEREKK